MLLPDRPVLSVVVPPAPVVTLAQAKAHLRVDTADDDDLIEGMIAAATADVDGPTGWLGRALGQQTLSLTAAHFPGCGAAVDWRWGRGYLPRHRHDEIELRCPPVLSIASVTYLDPTSTRQTLDPSSYVLSDRILFLPTGTWPPTAWRPDAVVITYVAGYAADALPAPIRSALLLRVGTLYANRNDAAAVVSTASDALLGPWRVYA